MKEELGIVTNHESLRRIGAWGFSYKNELVGNYSHPANTTLFFVELPFDQIAHLVIRELNPTTVNVFDVREYDFVLDETNFVVFIPQQILETLPSSIATSNKKFDGHHREILRRASGLSPKEISYLEYFEVNF